MQVNQLKKSSFITSLSIISIMVALYSIIENISMRSMQSSPEFQIAQQMLPSAFVSSTAIYFEIALNIAAIIASIGLYMRLNWGRLMYMVVLVLITLWEIYSSVSSYIALNALLKGYNFGNSLTLIVLLSLLGIGINMYLIWKLSTDNIKSEFIQSTY